MRKQVSTSFLFLMFVFFINANNLHSVSGTATLRFTPAFWGNPNIPGSEISPIGVPLWNGQWSSIIHPTIELNLIQELGDYGLLFNLAGKYNNDLSLYHSLKDLQTEDDQRYTLPRANIVKKYIDNVNLTFSGNGVSIEGGDATLQGVAPALESRGFFGILATYKYDFANTYRPTMNELSPLINRLNNSLSTENFNLISQLEKERAESQSFVQLSGGGGWAEMRDIKFDETNATNGRFYIDNDELDLYDNDLKNPSIAPKQNELIGAVTLLSRMGPIGFGATGVYNSVDDQKSSTNSLLYPTPEYTYSKLTFGLSPTLYLDKDRASIKFYGGYNKSDLTATSNKDSVKTSKTGTIGGSFLFDYTTWSSSLDLKWAEKGYEDGGALGAAEANITAADLSFQATPSAKFGTIGFKLGMSFDTDNYAENVPFIGQFIILKSKNYKFTDETKVNKKFGLPYRTSFKDIRLNSTWFNYSQTKQYKLKGSTNTNSASSTKIDWASVSLSGISVAKISITPSGKYSTFNDVSDKLKNYWFGNFTLKLARPLIPNMLDLEYNFKYSQKNFNHITNGVQESVEPFNLNVSLKPNSKIKTGFTVKYSYTDDFQKTIDADGFAYKFSIGELQINLPLAITLNSKLKMNLGLTWAKRSFSTLPLTKKSDPKFDSVYYDAATDYLKMIAREKLILEGYGPNGTLLIDFGLTTLF